MAEVNAAHGAGARLGAAPARDVSVVALEDLPAGRHREAHGTLQDILHLGLQGGLPRLCLLQLSLQEVDSFLQKSQLRSVTYYISI